MKFWPLVAMTLFCAQCDSQSPSSQSLDVSLPSTAEQPTTLTWISNEQFYKGFCSPGMTVTREHCQVALIHGDVTMVKANSLASMVRLTQKSMEILELEKTRLRESDPLIVSYTTELKALNDLKTRDVEDIDTLEKTFSTNLSQVAILGTDLNTLVVKLADIDKQLAQNPNDATLKALRETVVSDIDADKTERDGLLVVNTELATQINDLKGQVSDVDFQIESAQQKLTSRLNTGIFTSPKLKQLMTYKVGMQAAQTAINGVFTKLADGAVIDKPLDLNQAERVAFSNLVFKDAPRHGIFRRNNANFDCNHKIVPQWKTDHYELQVEWMECSSDTNRATKTFVCDANLICKGMAADGTERKITVLNNSSYEYANGDTTDKRDIEAEFLL